MGEPAGDQVRRQRRVGTRGAAGEGQKDGAEDRGAGNTEHEEPAAPAPPVEDHQQPDRNAAENRGADVDDRKGIAAHAEGDRGRPLDEEQEDAADGERDAVSAERGGTPLAANHPDQRQPAGAGGDPGQALHADRGHPRGEEAGGRGGAGSIRDARQGDDVAKSENELDVVMIDSAGREEVPKAEGGGDHAEGEEHAVGTGEARGEAADKAERHGKEHERPDESRQPLGHERVDGPREGGGQHRDRQVDEARPVHLDPRRRKPGRGHVVPALPGEEIADLDHAHGVVGVGEEAGKGRSAVDDQHQDGDEEGDEGVGEPIMPAGRGGPRRRGSSRPGSLVHDHFTLSAAQNGPNTRR